MEMAFTVNAAQIGSCCQLGKIANKVKGNARAKENPSIPQKGPLIPPLTAASTKRGPIIPLVHEKETRDSVNAMKKIPITPPRSA